MHGDRTAWARKAGELQGCIDSAWSRLLAALHEGAGSGGGGRERPEHAMPEDWFLAEPLTTSSPAVAEVVSIC